MGAWGLSSFENDDAADWVYAFEEQGADLIVGTLNAALVDGDPGDECHPEAPECCEALAAAEIVAAARTGDHAHLSGEAAVALKKLDSADVASPEHIVLAKEAVERVKVYSELRVLWKDTDEFNDWIAEVDRLISQLA